MSSSLIDFEEDVEISTPARKSPGTALVVAQTDPVRPPGPTPVAPSMSKNSPPVPPIRRPLQARPRPPQEVRRRLSARALLHGSPFASRPDLRGRSASHIDKRTATVAVLASAAVVLGVLAWQQLRRPKPIELLSKIVSVEPARAARGVPHVPQAPARTVPAVAPLTVQMATGAAESVPAAATLAVASHTGTAAPLAGPRPRLRLDAAAWPARGAATPKAP